MKRKAKGRVVKVVAPKPSMPVGLPSEGVPLPPRGAMMPRPGMEAPMGMKRGGKAKKGK
jgi:hypothetical protein